MFKKPAGVLMFLLVILKVLGTAETVCSCTASVCHCHIRGLTSVPQDLPTTITFLDLVINRITTLSQSDFSEYTSLEMLDLAHNDISTINSQAFSHLSSLTIMWLYGNQITVLRADMFMGLENLREFYISSNPINDIQAGTFESTPKLRSLNLSNNKLTVLRADMFTGLGNLEILQFQGNDITDIQAGTFNPTSQLTFLRLSYNKLTTLRSDMFTGLGKLDPTPNVGDLRLSDNTVVTFPFEDLSNIQTISRLTLHNNQMTTLPSVAYDVLSSISTVNIDNNPWQCDCRMVEFKLKMIEPSSFDKQITCSHPGNFSGQNLVGINPEDLMIDCQKPNITRFERVENYLLLHGQTVRLFCEATGIPTPEITFILPSGLEFNATVLSAGRVTVWENGTIIVTGVTAADSGRYACIATNSAGSTLAYFSTDVVYFETSPTFSLPILILYLIAAVAGTLVIVAIVLTIWCKCCRKDRSVGPDAGTPAMMGRRHGARVPWDHPLGM
ncbi:PREDICTED: chondroadherin-like [Branchiostoma belcheri]|uniref:Chondroadherin-like n=1 Tax=Branchiostoma belcheri TaxID=7741 RepID=A0A6P4YXQ0_BRABE|nr:PREDICTED: chondroadherin-like [Branchiostoma belcheri]